MWNKKPQGPIRSAMIDFPDKQLYETINVGEAPLKILQLSYTRWQAVSACLNRVLGQYEELRLHFQLAKDKDRSYSAEIVFQM